MKKLLLSILSIQFFFVLLYSETDFPPFKDPLNQLDFETKRIYFDSVRVYKSTYEFHMKYYNYISENSEIWKKYNDIENNDIRPSSMLSTFSNKNKATTSAISNRAIALLSGEDEKLFSFEEFYREKWEKYTYVSSIIMTRNNEQITETDLLRIIGSDREAGSLERLYDEKLELWEKNKFIEGKIPNGFLSLSSIALWGWAQFCFMGELTHYLAGGDDPLLGSFLDRMGHGIPQYAGYYILAKLAVGPLASKIKIEQPKPAYIQQYSNEQLIAIIDSYNNYIYDEIKAWEESDIE